MTVNCKRIHVTYWDGFWIAVDRSIVNPIPWRITNGCIVDATAKDIVAYAEYNYKFARDAREYVINSAKRYCERNCIPETELEIDGDNIH